MKDNKYHFIIPGLCHIPEFELTQLNFNPLKKLSYFLRHSTLSRNLNSNLDDTFAQYLGANYSWVNKLCDEPNQGNVLIASPIFLKADINSTWAQPVAKSEIIEQVMADLCEYFSEDIELLKSIDGHFVIQFKQCEVNTEMPHYYSIIGNKVDAYSALIREHLDWYKLLNEMQMYLHAHPINNPQSTSPIFNSLWFWGGDSRAETQLDLCLTSDDLLTQAVFKQPQNQSKQTSVHINTQILKYLKFNEKITLEKIFFNIELSLENSPINQIKLEDGAGNCFVYNPFSKYRFWKKKRSCSDLLTIRHL